MSTPSIYTVALILGRLTHSRVLGLLKKPSYAGTYVFGRYRYVKSVTTDGEVRKNMRAMPAPDWCTCMTTTRATSPWRSSSRTSNAWHVGAGRKLTKWRCGQHFVWQRFRFGESRNTRYINFERFEVRSLDRRPLSTRSTRCSGAERGR